MILKKLVTEIKMMKMMMIIIVMIECRMMTTTAE
jgi:hypothetical protein